MGAELPCAIGILEGIVVAVVLVIVTNLGPDVVTELVVKLLLVVHPPKTESGKALAQRLSSSPVARGDKSSCRDAKIGNQKGRCGWDAVFLN